MLIYDCEIIQAVPPRDGVRLPGVQYCKGWEDHAGMGVAVVCAYDYERDEYRVFGGNELDAFFDLCIARHKTISFNGFNFDRKLLTANAKDGMFDTYMPAEKEYDILREVWRAVGLGPTFSPRTHGGYSLDALAAANGLPGKSGDGGAMAPINWQRGNYTRVIDYCLHDVRITKGLMDKIIRNGVLKNGKPLPAPAIIHMNPFGKIFPEPTTQQSMFSFEEKQFTGEP